MTEIYIGPCDTCGAKGGTLEHDTQGDGVWATPVTYFTPCDDCIYLGLCPGCCRAIPADDAPKALDDIDTFTCEACGWHFEAERFEPSEDDYIDEY